MRNFGARPVETIERESVINWLRSAWIPARNRLLEINDFATAGIAIVKYVVRSVVAGDTQPRLNIVIQIHVPGTRWNWTFNSF